MAFEERISDFFDPNDFAVEASLSGNAVRGMLFEEPADSQDADGSRLEFHLPAVDVPQLPAGRQGLDVAIGTDSFKARQLKIEEGIAILTLERLGEGGGGGGIGAGYSEDRIQLTLADGYKITANLRVPENGSAPWPVVFLAHGQGGSAWTAVNDATKWASKGYVALTYDARGQGEAVNLNASTKGFLGGMSVLDLVDVMSLPDLLDTHAPNVIDRTRMFVSGTSQGGRVAAMAALWSGELPPTYAVNQGWWPSGVSFPVWAGAAIHNLWPDVKQRGVPTGTDFSHNIISNAYLDGLSEFTVGGPSDQGFRWDATNWALIEPYYDANNPTGLDTFFSGDERFDAVYGQFASKFAGCSVPIVWHQAFDDAWGRSSDVLEAVRTGNNGSGTVILNMSTGGHRTSTNAQEEAARDAITEAVFDKVAFDDGEGLVELGITSGELADVPEAILGVVPSTITGYRGDSLWPKVYAPNADALTDEDSWTDFYLRAGNALADTAPTLPTGSTVASLTWNDASYGIDDYIATSEAGGNHFNEVLLAASPKASMVNPGFAAPLPVGGRLLPPMRAELYLEADVSDFHVCAILEIDEPDRSERQIVAAYKSVTGHSVGGGPELHTLDFPPYVYDLTIGRTIRLKVYPLAIQAPPYEGGYAFFRIIPKFGVDYGFNVHHNSASPSRLRVRIGNTNQEVIT